MEKECNIVLMLIEKEGIKHCCLVKSLSRLLSSQVSADKAKHHFCLRCMNEVKIDLPEKDIMLKYKNYHRSEKVAFIIYADFESYIRPLHSCDPNPEGSYTK